MNAGQTGIFPSIVTTGLVPVVHAMSAGFRWRGWF